MTIVSRRHPYKFYLTLILGSIFMIGLGIALLGLFVNKFGNDGLKPSMYLMLPLAIGVTLLGPFTIYKYIKNAPRIIVAEESISFNGENYFFHEIEKIKFTGKQNFPYIVPYAMEATTIYFHNGQRRFIFDDMYENAWEIKSYLHQVYLQKKMYTPREAPVVTQSELDAEMFYTFKGSAFISFRAIIFWSILILILFLLFKNPANITNFTVLVIVAYAIFWTALHGWMMHYFEVSEKFLVIRNHIFLWKKKIYLLGEIKEVVYETRNKMPNCLRVITKDFKTKLYPAGTLLNKTWLELKENLESQGVKVRNECI